MKRQRKPNKWPWRLHKRTLCFSLDIYFLNRAMECPSSLTSSMFWSYAWSYVFWRSAVPGLKLSLAFVTWSPIRNTSGKHFPVDFWESRQPFVQVKQQKMLGSYLLPLILKGEQTWLQTAKDENTWLDAFNLWKKWLAVVLLCGRCWADGLAKYNQGCFGFGSLNVEKTDSISLAVFIEMKRSMVFFLSNVVTVLLD